MKLLALDVNRTLSNITDEQVYKLVDECKDILHLFSKLEMVIKPKSEGGEFEELDDIVLDAQLDVIEEIDANLKYDSLRLFSQGFFAPNYSLTRRIDTSVHYLDIAKKMIRELSEAYVYLSTEQIEGLKKLAYHVLGEVSYFLYFQFRLNETEASIKNKEELVLSVAIKSYLDDSGEVLESFLNFLKDIMVSHRPELTIFEAFPDLEDEFYLIAGAYIKDFEAMEEFLTIDIVSAVIKGEMDPEDAVRSLQEKAAAAESLEEGEIDG